MNTIVSLRKDWRWALLLAVSGIAALWIGWIGFIASDDSLYYGGAVRWLTDPPYAGGEHWSTRFPLILTFAAALRVFGRNYLAFAATALVCYLALVLLMGRFAHRLAGAQAGWIAAVLTATLPVVVSHASTVSVDLLEACFLLAGAMLLGEASDDAGGLRRGLLAGASFGMAILCRETTIVALVASVPIFVLGKPVPRRVLIASGVGLLLVLGGEALFQAYMTGEPLRRYTIALHHDEHIDRAANMEGNFLLWPPIDPILVLLVNDDFGLLFWIAGAALWLGALRGVEIDRKRGLWVLGAMAASSFVLVAVLVHKLVLNPRYFMLPALFAILVVTLWLDRLTWRWRALAIAGIVGSNLLLMSVGNAHPRWEMEALVDAARALPLETISADPVDVRRATVPMAFLSQGNNTRYAPASPGGLLITRADRAPPGRIIRAYPSPPTRLGAILQRLHLQSVVPTSISRRMFSPSAGVVLVRVAPSG
jgi:4-amino-4-deoxy-L-arabinose transferase-like glycosyltransferase